MALTTEQIEELKSHIAVARQRDLAFGLCLGKSPETTLLMGHRTKEPEAVGMLAKRAGETNKLAFGMMKVEGKVLNLSCANEVPPGLARKTKEMFKFIGLKMKVRLLDAEGNLLEEDGDEDEDGADATGAKAKPKDVPVAAAPAEEDPLQGKWAETHAKVGPILEQALAAGGGDLGKMRAVWSFAQSKASGDPPDYAAALKSVGMLVKLIADGRAAGQDGAAKPVKAPEPAMAGDGDGGAGTAPAGATPAGTAPAGPAPAGTAPASPVPASAAGPAGSPATPTAAPTPDLAAPKAAPVDLKGTYAEKLKRAQDGLAALNTLIASYTTMIAGPAEPVPGPWATEVARIKTVLDALAAPGAAEDAKKLDKALQDITKQEQAVRDRSVEKQGWKKALELFQLRFATIEHHAKASADPQVKPKIDKIRADLAAAQAKATAMKFKEAEAALPPLMKACDDVELKADAFAHYDTIRAQRQAIVTPLVGTTSTVPDIDKLIKDITGLMTKATADAAADKYADAIKKLDQIPPLEDKRKRLAGDPAAVPPQTGDKSDYDAVMAKWTGFVGIYEAADPAVLANIATELAEFKAKLAEADYAKTKDYSVSMRKLEVMSGLSNYMVSTFNAARAYLAALTPFETQLQTYKDHKGRAGIEEFYLGMVNDHESAKAEAALKKHSTAQAILDRTKTKWPAQTAIADACLAYGDKRKVVEKAINDLRPRKGAAAVLQQADALMTTATQQALAKDFVAALASVNEAEKRAADAKAAADAQDALGALKDGAALDAMAADFDKAYKVFTDMKAHVVSKDAGGALATFIATADAPAARALAEKGKPAPNWTEARKALDDAIAILESALAKVLARVPFAAHLAQVKVLAVTLGTVNLDDCIKPRLDTVNRLATEAENLGKAPAFDFAAGEVKLAEALGLAQGAQKDAALWPQLKAARTAADAVLASITVEPTVVPFMAARITQLAKLKTDGAARQAANDFAGALKLAQEAQALGPATTTDVAMVKQIVVNKPAWIDTRLPQITGPGKEAAAAALATTNRMLADFQKMKTAGNYDGAWLILNETYFAIQKGIDAIAAKAAYDPVRTDVAAKIKAVADVRNPGVETALKEIEAKFAAGEAKAAAGDFPGAQAVITPLGPLATALLPKATAWKAFDDARAATRAKLDAAAAHKKADTIQPVLDRLGSRYTAGVKTSETDPAAAKTEMQAIATACDEAVKAANDAAAFADAAKKAGDGAGPDAGPTPAELKIATDSLASLKAMPEAPAAAADLKEATDMLAIAANPATVAQDGRTALKATMEALTRAQAITAKVKQVDVVAKSLLPALAALRMHPQAPYIAGDLDTLDRGVQDAVKGAQGGADVATASANLDFTGKEIERVKAIADAQAKYLVVRAEPAIEPRLEVLEKHAHRYAIKPAIDSIRAKLAEAAKKSADHKPAEALTLLEEVRALGQSALVLAEMRGDTPPTVADVKAILARPGGQAELDAIIDQLEPDAQSAVLRVAFEARFGCTLQAFSAASQAAGAAIPDAALSGPNLRKFYNDMADLPVPDTMGNDSMKIFTILQNSADGGSLYRPSKKEIVMREGDAAFSSAYSFGQKTQVGDVDPGCEPANEEPVSFFSWNTLHEVGHAVDDKHGYMNKNGSRPDHGAWTQYSNNTLAVAEKLAAKYKYDLGYLGQVLDGKAAPALPPCPTTGANACTPEEWEQRRIAATSHIASARVGQSPWASQGIATRLEIDGRVYEESYANSWNSYSFAARKQGITHYQFRAPGEWFAELYAAYHSGKLKPGHPAVAWLSAL